MLQCYLSTPAGRARIQPFCEGQLNDFLFDPWLCLGFKKTRVEVTKKLEIEPGDHPRAGDLQKKWNRHVQ